MLKNLLTRKAVQIFQRNLSVPVPTRSKFNIKSLVPEKYPPSSQGRDAPNTNQSVILTNVSGSTTESSLREALGTTPRIRKVELEPGCTFHFLNESEADFSAKLIGDNLNLKSQVLGATIPSLLLRNLSENITVESLRESFGLFNPQSIKLTGGLTIDIVVKDAANAVNAAKSIETIKFSGNHLKTTTTKLGNNKFTVQAYNVPIGITQEEVEKSILSAVSDSITIESMTATPAVSKTVVVRLSAEHSQNLTAISEALSKIATISVTDLKLQRPSVEIRNIKGFTDEKSLVALFHGREAERVQVVRASKDRIQSVVAYFADEKAALSTLKSLKDVNLNGKVLNVAYTQQFEPAVTVSNLPVDVTEQDISTLFSAFEVGKISIHAGAESSSATVLLSSHKDSGLAVEALNRRRVQDKKVVVESNSVGDIGITLTAASGGIVDEAAVTQALQSVGVTAKSLLHESNRSAFVGFMNADQVVRAQNGLLKGTTQVETIAANSSAQSGAVLSSSVTVAPSFVLQVVGLSPDMPSNEVTSVLVSAGVHSVKADRTALVKFKAHRDVADGIKALKLLRVDDNLFKVRKYLPLSNSGTSEYDVDEDHVLNKMDQFSLKGLLKDYMQTDPATRYQVAKNYFERALNDAKARPDLQRILDNSATVAMKSEVAQLLKQVSGDEQTSQAEASAASQRLFELFLQREDMQRFSSDFKAIEAFLGPVNESDPFDWTQFQADSEEDIDKLRKEVKRAEMANAQKVLESLRGSGAETELIIKGEKDEEDVRVSLEDPTKLRDRDGNIWSGVILNEDTVQKVTPGQRIITFRVLVVVGNLKGAAGFGMGKGQTGAEALNSAFRAALRELKHVDLFENFGLAHDVHGKHNSCQAYIRATPRTREFVGSLFAFEVLSRFGIGSASVKLRGRRDPYAMVNAIFNAVAKHENIDEFAKDRGKRYLSLKWAYDNSV